MTISDLAGAVRQSVTAMDVAKMIGMDVNRAGFCRCPLHGEKTGSMKIYPGTRGWYCFGCHKGGSAIDLVMDYYGMNLKEAIEMLNAEFCLGLPIGYVPTKEQEAEAKRRAAEREEASRKRREREQRREAAYERYLDVGAEIAKLERTAEMTAPRRWNAPMAPEYVDAVNRLPELRDEAEYLATICFGKEEKE